MKLSEAIRTTIRRLHYSPRTEESYIRWALAFVGFHGRRHPRDLGAAEITAFLNDLAVHRRVSASTQNQALCALVFLYRKVLHLEMPELTALERAQRPVHLPAVLSPREVRALLDHLEAPFRLIGELLYGAGLRVGEVTTLRVKDIDLDRRQITVRRGKGQRDRPALLPASVRDGLCAQLDAVAKRHRAELDAGRGEVDLPEALRVKMPSAAASLAWQYVFPASRPCTDPATGGLVLYHLHESAVQKAIHDAVEAARIDKRASCHTLRHSFATHLLEAAPEAPVLSAPKDHTSRPRARGRSAWARIGSPAKPGSR